MNKQLSSKKLLILIFDALPYEHFDHYAYKLIPSVNKAEVIKLESLIGYSSGIFPSIWTGLPPDELNCWSEFKFNLNSLNHTEKTIDSNLINKLLKILPFFPSKLSQIISVVFSLIGLKLKLYKYIFPVFFDFKLRNLFKYEDNQKFIFHPEKTKNQIKETIFSKLRKENISYKYLYTIQFIENFLKYKQEVIFYYNPIMDIFGHKYGPNSIKYKDKINEIFKWVNNLILKRNFKIVLFSDHGMTSVYKKFYPLKVFKKLDLRLHKDIFVWLDSTILRIWFNSVKALKSKSELIKEFNKIGAGHFLTKEEKRKYGLNFKNRYFGDLLFLVDPYYEIFPNFFNINPFKITPGLHGYIPTHKSSYGIFYSNFFEYNEPMNIIDINKIILKILNVT